MEQLLPILKPADFLQGKDLFFKQRLFNSALAPVVAFGEDEGNRIAYSSAASPAEYETNFPAIRELALKNLSAINPTIDVTEAEGAVFAVVIGHEYSSEKILDEDFMRLVGERIGSTSMMVGIPFKGLLMATDSNSPMRLKFAAIMKQYFENPQAPPITDKVFVLENGKMVAMAGEKVDDGMPDKFAIIELMDTNNYRVDLEPDTLEEMPRLLQRSFEQIMLLCFSRKIFGGEVHYYIGDTLALDERLLSNCASYADQVQDNPGIQMVLGLLSRAGVTLFFYYHDELIVDGHQRAVLQASLRPDFSELEESGLRAAYSRIEAVPEEQRDAVSKAQYVALREEFGRRGLEVPGAGSASPGSASSPSSPGSAGSRGRKWWEFWK